MSSFLCKPPAAKRGSRRIPGRELHGLCSPSSPLDCHRNDRLCPTQDQQDGNGPGTSPPARLVGDVRLLSSCPERSYPGAPGGSAFQFKREAAREDSVTARAVWQGKQTRDSGSQDQPGDIG